MDTGTMLNLMDAILILGVAIPSLYMSARVTQPKLRLLTLLLAGFLLVHGLYHASYVLGDLTGYAALNSLGGYVLGPVSYLLFLAFALYFVRSTT